MAWLILKSINSMYFMMNGIFFPHFQPLIGAKSQPPLQLKCKLLVLKVHIHSMPQKQLNVGFISQWDINDPNAMSGSVHHSMQALKEAGVNIIDLSDIESEWTKVKISRKMQPVKSFLTQYIPQWLKTKYQLKLSLYHSTRDRYFTYNEYNRSIKRANEISDLAQAKLDKNQQQLDLLFGVCTSTLFYNLHTNLPIVYASDTTAELLNTTYPEYIARSDQYHKACNEIEKTSLDKSRFFLPAAACARESAINFYKLSEEKVHSLRIKQHLITRTCNCVWLLQTRSGNN